MSLNLIFEVQCQLFEPTNLHKYLLFLSRLFRLFEGSEKMMILKERDLLCSIIGIDKFIVLI